MKGKIAVYETVVKEGLGDDPRDFALVVPCVQVFSSSGFADGDSVCVTVTKTVHNPQDECDHEVVQSFGYRYCPNCGKRVV